MLQKGKVLKIKWEVQELTLQKWMMQNHNLKKNHHDP